jgi:hypothetical protein
VLLHNGEDCNVCITNRICSHKHSFHDNTNIIQNMTKSNTFFITFIFNHRSVIEKISSYDTFHDLCKQRFVMQPLQNPPLCCSTELAYLKDDGGDVVLVPVQGSHQPQGLALQLEQLWTRGVQQIQPDQSQHYIN